MKGFASLGDKLLNAIVPKATAQAADCYWTQNNCPGNTWKECCTPAAGSRCCGPCV